MSKLLIKDIELKREITKTSCSVWCHVDGNYNGFKGHFDQYAVLPGVVQLNFVTRLIKDILESDEPLDICEMKAVKFHNIITPGTSFLIEINLKQSKWHYKISNEKQKFASGVILINDGK